MKPRIAHENMLKNFITRHNGSRIEPFLGLIFLALCTAISITVCIKCGSAIIQICTFALSSINYHQCLVNDLLDNIVAGIPWKKILFVNIKTITISIGGNRRE